MFGLLTSLIITIIQTFIRDCCISFKTKTATNAGPVEKNNKTKGDNKYSRIVTLKGSFKQL